MISKTCRLIFRKVFNTVGQHMYDAKEDTDCCTRQCCGPSRPFDMTIKNLQGTEVIHLYRLCLNTFFIQFKYQKTATSENSFHTNSATYTRDKIFLDISTYTPAQSAFPCRPLRCQSCLVPCCLQELEVSSPPGSVIGRVEQDWSLCHPKFTIKDQQDQAVLRLEGPFCTCKGQHFYRDKLL